MPQMQNTGYYESIIDERDSRFSPRLLSSSQQYAPRPARAPSRSPPTRERTPIRHHRPSISRARSGSRPDALLAYVNEHESQSQQGTTLILPSQSAPSTPPIFSTSFMAPGTCAPMQLQTEYYASPPIAQSNTQYFQPVPPYMSSDHQPFVGLNRTMSHGSGFDLQTLNPQESVYLPNPMQAHPSGIPSLGSNVPPHPLPSASLESSPEGFRVLASRPKPQCWDHGCNGRQFSTFSNLLRHQREKSGSAMKSVCPHCGTEFTRTTARNGHLYGGKCKGRPEAGEAVPSGSKAPSITESE